MLLRGNVETRLRKVESGEVDATLLALAGLKRLGLAAPRRAVLDLDTFLPAAGQGAIAITARSGDARALEALGRHLGRRDRRGARRPSAPSWPYSTARAARRSQASPGSRRARLRLMGEVLRPDGSERFDISAEGAPADAERLGREAGRDLAARLPEGVLVKGG